MTELMDGQVSIFDQDIWSGKMSPEPSAPMGGKTSQRSSKKQSVSQSRKPPLFLYLKKDGPQQDASWETNGALHGEFSMHSFGESPKEGVESHLSQILEDTPHPRYSLSAKACQGILNRANRRGKKLPEMLEKALVEQSLALSKSEEDVVGGGKGALVQTDKSATLSTLQDQTLFQPVIAVDQGGGKSGANSYEDVSPTLTCTHGGEPAVVYGIQGSMIGRADHNDPQGDGINEDVSFTLNTTDRHAVVYGISPFHSNCMKSDNPHSGYYEADTARTLDALQCGYPGCNQGGMAVVQPILDDQGGSRISVRVDGKSPTIRAEAHGNLPCVMEPYSIGNGQVAQIGLSKVARSLDCMHDQQAIVQPIGTFQETGIGWWNEKDVGATLRAMSGGDAMKANLVVAGVDCRNATEIPGQNITLQSSCYHNLNSGNVVRVKHIVRRLTPLECERLQGFPDNWTFLPQIKDMTEEKYEFWKAFHLERAVREGTARENEFGVMEVWKLIEGDDDEECEWINTHKPYKHKDKTQMINWYNRMINSDSARYKALGNSIALPPWKWIIKRLCACYERDATLASLFDGIGGFPLIWEQLNGKGSCLWASEIEDFPMAVTIYRFGGNENG